MAQSSGKGAVRCDFPPGDCQTYFSRRCDMQRHKREYHQGKKHCPHSDCLYATKRQDRMTKHIKKSHTVTLNVAHAQDSLFLPSLGQNQQIQQLDDISSDIPGPCVLPESDNFEAVVTATPTYFNNTMGFDNDLNTSQSTHHGMANEELTENSFVAPTMINSDTPQLSNQSPPQAAQPYSFSPEATLPAAPNYGSHDVRSQYTSFDSNTPLTGPTPYKPSAFPYEASYLGQHIHHPIHAAALFVESGLYDADYVFETQNGGFTSVAFQAYGNPEDKNEGSQ